ncbi:hypothetical protein [Streptomyces sp. NPDC090053]|uniref:hypothetical protein n=1 Tax=Streptomyces sp. NPDC090053 TaxID=3365932 RepID=UPI003829BF2C
MNTPVNRTLLLLDIERYSDRTDVEQAYLRRMLYDITDNTLGAAAIDESQRQRADRGDSVMELIDANASVGALLRALITELPVQLRATNQRASGSSQIRLRAVLATGYVAIDDQNGWVGSDLNHACRLLDANELRSALRERPDDFALCVSDSVHQGIVRHGHPGIRPEEFRPITPDSKNGPLSAWLHGPLPTSAGSTPPSAAAAESGASPTSSAKPAGPGSVHIMGDQYGVAGGTVHGGANFSFGPRSGETR